MVGTTGGNCVKRAAIQLQSTVDGPILDRTGHLAKNFDVKLDRAPTVVRIDDGRTRKNNGFVYGHVQIKYDAPKIQLQDQSFFLSFAVRI